MVDIGHWILLHFWPESLIGSAERDQELGIDARLVGGAVLGRRLVEGPHTELSGTVGVVGSQEWIAGSSKAQANVEGVVGAAWDRVDKDRRLTERLNIDGAAFRRAVAEHVGMPAGTVQ